MVAVKRFKTLYDDSAAGTGDWIAMDVRYDLDAKRALNISLVDGDTVSVQVTTHDEKGIDKSFLDTLSSDEIVTLNTYTESGADVLEGPWTYIRIVKTGTAGTAKVTGFI